MTFISLFIITLTVHAILASPHVTLSQMKVDVPVFCGELCKYGLSGPGCDVDCSGVETVGDKFEVSTDLCDVLCKRGLGFDRCKCPDVDDFIKNENVMVCFGFYIYHKVSLNGCPKCPFQDMSLHKPPSNTGNYTRPTGNPYGHLIVTDEDKRLAEEYKKMYCKFSCTNHPERAANYCKCGQ